MVLGQVAQRTAGPAQRGWQPFTPVGGGAGRHRPVPRRPCLLRHSAPLRATPRHPPPVPSEGPPSAGRALGRSVLPYGGRGGGGARGRSCATLTLFIPLSLQGIERLKRKHQPREYRGSWKFVQDIFGGTFSLNWFNPFSGPWHPKPLSDGDWVQQAASTSETDNTEMTEERSGDTKDEDSVEVTDE